jgi:hypothetical protein
LTTQHSITRSEGLGPEPADPPDFPRRLGLDAKWRGEDATDQRREGTSAIHSIT